MLENHTNTEWRMLLNIRLVLNLAEPQVKPIVDKMIVLVDGQEVEVSIDLDEKIINSMFNADEVA